MINQLHAIDGSEPEGRPKLLTVSHPCYDAWPEEEPIGNLSGVVQQLSKERTRLENELHRVTAVLTAFGKVYFSGVKSKRPMSVAGRKRIAAAQRARGAKQKAGSKPTKPKRAMSAAARRKIAAAQRARWAKVRAKKAG